MIEKLMALGVVVFVITLFYYFIIRPANKSWNELTKPNAQNMKKVKSNE